MRVGRPQTSPQSPPPPPPSAFIGGCPKAALLFWFFCGLRCSVWLNFVILVRYKNRKWIKIDIYVRLAGNHLYGKWLFTWLSLVISLMVSYFVLSFSHETSWMRSGAELSQFLRIFLPTIKTSQKEGMRHTNFLDQYQTGDYCRFIAP